ncbi:hypothetical protein DL764_000516 [Monosporascus ibericus]|uniref:Uncharacterized protein n=1 Tax=Monosporascus ibericus TaxID=155417 RepID=A0A4Q4TTB2_9PEZI|nr:hypothetical protein DL764_000516 [Monosporascus ibericus]
MKTKAVLPDESLAQLSESSSDFELPNHSATSPTTRATSTSGEDQLQGALSDLCSDGNLANRLARLYDEKILVKLYRTATKYLPSDVVLGTNIRSIKDGFKAFPEYVPQDGPDAGRYVLREAEFWTCGYFPGTLYALLERAVRFPQALNIPAVFPEQAQRTDSSSLYSHLKTLCETWAEPLHAMSSRTDTHDIGFIVMPALRRDWELTGSLRSLESIIRAARSLASRYVPSVGAIRSWDLIRKKDVEILNMEENVICIIDSLCNLDLLYYAAEHSADGKRLAEIATTHAETIMRSHLRPQKPARPDGIAYNGQWYSTYHVAILDPKTNSIKGQMTAQGYSDSSTWARGQAWSIMGYAQCYMATKRDEFLHASCGLAEYFIHRLETSPDCVKIAVESTGAAGTHKSTKGRYVPLFDFDSPIENPAQPVRDSSAGVIAANGMLILSQALAGRQQEMLASRFREAAIRIVQDTLDFAFAPESASLVNNEEGGFFLSDPKPGQSFEAILKYGTANNNVNARKRYANHGLVYGDYYLVEFGNRLLSMGLV